MFVLPTQPMTLSDAIKNTFKLWRETLVSVLVLSVVGSLLNSLPQLMADQGLDKSNFGLYILITVIALLAGLIPLMAIFAKTGHAAHNQPITTSQSLATALVKYPAVLGWMLICTLAGSVLFGAAFLVGKLSPILMVLAIILVIVFISAAVVYLMCVVPLILFENLPIIAAAQKSYAMTKGHWWYGGLLLTVIVLINVLLTLPVVYLLSPVWGAFLVHIFIMPLQASAVIIFYEHLKFKTA